MTNLPPKSTFLTPDATKNDALNGFAQLHDYLSGLFGNSGDASETRTKLGTVFNATISRTADYAVTSADRGKIISCDGTFTVILPAASVMEDGFSVCLANTGIGTITVEAVGSDSIAGKSSYIVAQDTAVVITRFGTGGWSVIGAPPLSDAIDSDNSLTAASSKAIKTLHETWISERANTEFEQIGSYAILRSGGQMAGEIVSGTQLRYPKRGALPQNPSGSWQCMGNFSFSVTNISGSTSTANYGLFMRIA